MPSKLIKLLLLFSLPVILVVCNSKSVNISPGDKRFLEAFAREWKLTASPDSVHTDFTAEIQFITTVQEAVMTTVRHEEIAHKHFGDVAFYYKQRKGYCYDRAVLMEKLFLHYGFPFRHVYLYFSENEQPPSVFSLLQKNTSSHALVEVKTKKGWMAIGSNADWVGLTQDNRVLSTGSLREALAKGELKLQDKVAKGNCFWLEKGNAFGYVYGLYSRHGDFFNGSSDSKFSILHFIPDYNLGMMLKNF